MIIKIPNKGQSQKRLIDQVANRLRKDVAKETVLYFVSGTETPKEYVFEYLKRDEDE